MKTGKLAILYVLLTLFLSGCGSEQAGRRSEGDAAYTPAYAGGFTVTSHGGSSILTVKDPWQDAEGVEMELFLSRDGEAPPKGFSGTAVNVPLRRVVCMSSSYVAFIDALGEIDAVRGVSGAKYITNEVIRERYAGGSVRDVGYDAALNYELVASLRPDLVMVYGIAGENSAMTRKLKELGMNVIYIGDYVEQSPLGKAEWLVAFGEMFDKREEAEKLFAEIASSYNATRQMIADAPPPADGKPVVMLNAPYRDTWFVPGDRSYMARLVADAGGEYACAGDDSGRSRPISAENALISAWRSDVWLNPGQASTMRELVGLNPRFSDIPPVKNGRVFNSTKRRTPEGGSDFWESGAVRPDIVLQDMACILRPDLLPGREPYYFIKLE